MTEEQHLVSMATVATNFCAARPTLLAAFRRRIRKTRDLWFEVHGVDVDAVDATLLNEPFSIPHLHAGAAIEAGDRAAHGLGNPTPVVSRRAGSD